MKITLKRKKIDETELLQKTIREQKARIEDLKRENADLLFSLDEYTKKENSILESIGYLEEKKREQTENLNKKYALELQKLNFFEEKWLNIVRNSNDPSLFAGVSFTREALKNCREEILETTRKELKISKNLTAAEEDFAAETVRLNRLKEMKSADPSEESISSSEFQKYRSVLEKAEAEDLKSKRNSVRPAPDTATDSENLAETFLKQFGIPLSSARGKTGETTERADSRVPEVPVPRRSSEMRGSSDREELRPQNVTSDFEIPYPRKDRTDAAPISEPETEVSPRKMSDREIVSLLEKLSV